MGFDDRIVDIKKLGSCVRTGSAHEERVMEEWIPEIWILINEGLDRGISPHSHDEVWSESIEELVRLIGPVNNYDRIKALSPERKVEAHHPAECVNIAWCDRPADLKRAVSEIDTHCFHVAGSPSVTKREPGQTLLI